MTRVRTLGIFVLFASLYSTVQAAKGPLIDLGQQKGRFQGDIELPTKNRNAILRANRWPNGIVYYDLGTEWDQEQLALIKEGMQAIENSTCVRFKVRTTEPNYVTIRNTAGGCFSSGAGMQGGVQKISLQDDENGSCMVHHTIVHELLHCIGLWHEQSRYDRDDYITIRWENIANTSNERYQFRKINETASNTYGIPYNYLSVMHYSAFAYAATDGITMEPKDKTYLYEIGAQSHGHELDWEKVRRIYECKGTYTPAPATPVPCVDTYQWCDDYADDCGKKAWTLRSCRKSCGYCTGVNDHSAPPPTAGTEAPTTTAPCQDEISYCKDYARRCGREAWMEKSCKKTCRLC